MPIEDIVNVNISRTTTAVSRKAFGVPLFMGLNRVTSLVYEEYTSTADMITAGYLTTDAEYLAGLALFSQAISPPKLAIGRREVDVSTLSVSAVANSTLYRVTINGTDFDFTSDVSATALEIVTGLKAAIDGGSEPVTTGTIAADAFTITNDVSGARDSIVISTNLALAHTATQSLTADVAAIQIVNDEWYALVAHTHTKADILELAGVIEQLKKVYAYSTADADVVDTAASPSATDVASELQALSYARTFGLYDPDANTAFPESAWLGVMLPKDPGSATWKFKTLVGQDADALTSTQKTNAKAKSINTYQEIGGVSMTAEGVVAEGEYIDVIRGIDWLESRMEERVFGTLVNNDKVPYTDAGINVIGAEVSAQLNEGIAAGLLADDPAPTVSIPRASEVPVADKLARELKSLTFSAVLAGAIHNITINGTVTV